LYFGTIILYVFIHAIREPKKIIRKIFRRFYKRERNSKWKDNNKN